jgi:hypothetical protein
MKVKMENVIVHLSPLMFVADLLEVRFKTGEGTGNWRCCLLLEHPECVVVIWFLCFSIFFVGFISSEMWKTCLNCSVQEKSIRNLSQRTY